MTSSPVLVLALRGNDAMPSRNMMGAFGSRRTRHHPRRLRRLQLLQPDPRLRLTRARANSRSSSGRARFAGEPQPDQWIYDLRWQGRVIVAATVADGRTRGFSVLRRLAHQGRRKRSPDHLRPSSIICPRSRRWMSTSRGSRTRRTRSPLTDAIRTVIGCGSPITTSSPPPRNDQHRARSNSSLRSGTRHTHCRQYTCPHDPSKRNVGEYCSDLDRINALPNTHSRPNGALQVHM